MRNNVGLFLTKRASLSPELEGFVDPDSGRRFTFSEWNARSNRTAHFLRSLGVAPGDRVALLLMNGVEYMESFFALAKLGAICVPLNWRLVADELAYILRDAGARRLIFGGELREVVGELRERGNGDDGTPLESWIHVGSEAERPGGTLSYAGLQAGADDAEPPIGGEGDDELYIMYTSGTTGLPKGAVHTHHTASWAVLTINATADLRYGDRNLVALPLFHVGALSPITANVHRGATSIVMRTFDPNRAWQLISSEAVTNALKVPTMLNFMLQALRAEGLPRDEIDFSRLRWCMSGAAPVPVALIEAFAELGIEIHQVYGLTESCGPGCLIPPEEAIARAGSTGKAFFHTEVRVVREDGTDAPPGEAGEVWLRGAHIMKGYWNRPEETAEVLGDGWLRTGDVATLDRDGFVYIQDRLKDMIISGGENVYPAEVEGVLQRCDKVLEAAVIGQPDARWGESPLAIVVPSDPSLTAEELLAFCDGRLARFKRPKAVHFIDEIPRNPSGKILKRVLRERLLSPRSQEA